MEQGGVLERMHEQGIVAVLRSESAQQAVQVAGACVAGGVELVEVTFSVPGADRAIAACAEAGYTVGAGTVLDVAQAEASVAAGARFVVAPTFDAGIAAYCAGAGVPYVPGCMTVNEMHAAVAAGCELVKLFPASQFTPDYLKAIHAPLPRLRVMPTGGIGLDNIGAWLRAGAYCAGAGGKLTTLGPDGLEGVTALARRYRAVVDEARS